MELKTERISRVFADRKAKGGAAFVAYICAGDPTAERTVEIAEALVNAGVDVLELGVPFSDPSADGLVNQMAADRALKAGASVRVTLEIVRRIREFSEIPIVLFTYLNPIYTYGFAQFGVDALAAGVDGALLLDLPPDEAAVNEELRESLLPLIRLVAPTTPSERIERIATVAEGFIYYVSQEGVTGVRANLATDLLKQVEVIKQYAQVPVVVGFGISTPQQTAEVAASADGVVVGSAIVRLIEKYGDSVETVRMVEEFVRPLTRAAHTGEFAL